MNEMFQLTYMYFLLIFSDFISNKDSAKIKEISGYIFIALIIAQVTINIIIMLVEMIKDIVKLVKKIYYRIIKRIFRRGKYKH